MGGVWGGFGEEKGEKKERKKESKKRKEKEREKREGKPQLPELALWRYLYKGRLLGRLFTAPGRLVAASWL